VGLGHLAVIARRFRSERTSAILIEQLGPGLSANLKKFSGAAIADQMLDTFKVKLI